MAGKNKVSKNARRGVIADKLVCKCGGSIIMKTTVAKGTMRHFAQCTGTCGATSRKPRELMGK